ncbi:MAG: hypothetical protein GEV07_18725 [Streptosporangiales bacterium]|nr:hypothetical protein [Streptosporangiales bacterium]
MVSLYRHRASARANEPPEARLWRGVALFSKAGIAVGAVTLMTGLSDPVKSTGLILAGFVSNALSNEMARVERTRGRSPAARRRPQSHRRRDTPGHYRQPRSR